MKRIFLIIVSLSFSVAGIAQTSLEECQKLAARNYPMIRQYDLVEKTMKYSLSDISREWLPKVSLSARASYQSDVASFSDKLLQVYKSMGVDMKGLNKDQYRTEVDITQTIWDGGASRAESRFTLAQGEADRESVAVDMYAVRGRVNDLFFGALLADAQVRETGLVMNLLAADLEKIKSYLANGTVMQSDADAVEAELLTVKQQMTGLEAAKDSYLAMLSIFTGIEVDSVSVPDEIYVGAMENNRPELSYMESLEDKFSAQEQAVRASTYPRIGLSVQGFYGNPGLNLFKDMMENRWTWNYSAGLRLQWNFGAYYTKRNKLLSLSAAKDRVAVN
ncbi:MAG: TolC family protein, partial [Bacteroidales bacterium]|nr:TolC family protein [Bacteroidales bacterium]